MIVVVPFHRFFIPRICSLHSPNKVRALRVLCLLAFVREHMLPANDSRCQHEPVIYNMSTHGVFLDGVL